MPRKRQKASDEFRDTETVFGKKVIFEEAFPDIEDVKIEVVESGEGIYHHSRRRNYGKSVGEYIDCSNNLCYKGGFSIGFILREMVKNKKNKFLHDKRMSRI